uniref:Uncharacterized protein n=1 Tax=Myoviridae sp. ctwwN25 TaxID=2825209 RepID=A0A8S5PPF2_9CAUD|nr:MAG TPA: hypothetical protein [Myoviridae sp. ctwwN25]DAR38308.1 MAG TPA: hypothetical protein [Caudoviricetes sp.]
MVNPPCLFFLRMIYYSCNNLANKIYKGELI